MPPAYSWVAPSVHHSQARRNFEKSRSKVCPSTSIGDLTANESEASTKLQKKVAKIE
jgi:hypothetical protein